MAEEIKNFVEEEKVIEYTSGNEKVKLSKSIVRKSLVKGDQTKVTDQEILQFICICKYNQLNPFLNEAYLVKFGNDAQMVVSKEAMFKRADACPNFEGIQAGVIVRRNGEIVDVEGCFVDKNEELLGGWAKVFRSDRKYPIVARCSLIEFEKSQATWKTMKSTMISKVAKVQALREAFPNQLGAIYTKEEQHIEDATYVDVKDEIDAKANKEELPIHKEPEPIAIVEEAHVQEITKPKKQEVPSIFD